MFDLERRMLFRLSLRQRAFVNIGSTQRVALDVQSQKHFAALSPLPDPNRLTLERGLFDLEAHGLIEVLVRIRVWIARVRLETADQFDPHDIG